MRIVLFQPDIPQNTGNILRLAACFDVSVDIIEPVGFFYDDKKLKRSALDYYKHVRLKKHIDWESYYHWSKIKKFNLVLLTTKSNKKYSDYKFKTNDSIILGRESAGVPGKHYQPILKVSFGEGRASNFLRNSNGLIMNHQHCCHASLSVSDARKTTSIV